MKQSWSLLTSCGIRIWKIGFQNLQLCYNIHIQMNKKIDCRVLFFWAKQRTSRNAENSKKYCDVLLFKHKSKLQIVFQAVLSKNTLSRSPLIRCICKISKWLTQWVNMKKRLLVNLGFNKLLRQLPLSPAK